MDRNSRSLTSLCSQRTKLIHGGKSKSHPCSVFKGENAFPKGHQCISQFSTDRKPILIITDKKSRIILVVLDQKLANLSTFKNYVEVSKNYWLSEACP